ncbi:hypothetical protein C8R44DRAFT_740409 [Mycena epipterygia]|nr:hypothetical protein C8R44DRAFT_740409 [Mycena epipterygia]
MAFGLRSHGIGFDTTHLHPLLPADHCVQRVDSRGGSYSRIVISGGETVVVQIAVLRVASGNPWLAHPPNPAEPRLADARRWAALAAHGLDRLAAASRHLAGTSGYLWIGGAVGIRSLNAVDDSRISGYPLGVYQMRAGIHFFRLTSFRATQNPDMFFRSIYFGPQGCANPFSSFDHVDCQLYAPATPIPGPAFDPRLPLPGPPKVRGTIPRPAGKAQLRTLREVVALLAPGLEYVEEERYVPVLAVIGGAHGVVRPAAARDTTLHSVSRVRRQRIPPTEEDKGLNHPATRVRAMEESAAFFFGTERTPVLIKIERRIGRGTTERILVFIQREMRCDTLRVRPTDVQKRRWELVYGTPFLFRSDFIYRRNGVRFPAGSCRTVDSAFSPARLAY